MIRNSKGQFFKKELMSEKERQFFVNINKGRKHTEETKEKMRGERKGGHKWSEEAKKRISNKGRNHNGYKTGRTTISEGYIILYMPEHPNSNNKYYQEHRYVVEQKIGRYLTKKEVVHHINENITDNRIENLYLFKTNGKHSAYHGKLKWKKIKPIIKSNLI